MAEFEVTEAIEPSIEIGSEEQFSELLTSLQTLQVKLENGDPLNMLQFYAYRQQFIKGFRGQRVFVNGTQLASPTTDEYGHVIGSRTSTAGMYGTFEDVHIVGVSSDGTEKTSTIGLSIKFGGVSFSSPIEQTTIAHLAFAPISSSTFLLEYDTVPLPADDDKMASDLGILLLDAPNNPDGLAEYVREEFTALTELQQEFYVSYLNYLASFHEITCLTTRLMEINGTEIRLTEFAEAGLVEGTFQGFRVIQAKTDPNADAKISLLAARLGQVNGSHCYILIDDIEDIELH